MKFLKKKKTRSIWSDKQGSFAYAIFFFIAILIVLFVFAFFNSVMIRMQTSIFEGTEDQIDAALADAAEINDANMRAQVENSLNASKASIPNQIEIMSSFITYAWLIVVVIIGVVWFLIAKRSSEREIA